MAKKQRVFSQTQRLRIVQDSQIQPHRINWEAVLGIGLIAACLIIYWMV